MQADGLTLQLLKPLDGFSDVVIGDRARSSCQLNRQGAAGTGGGAGRDDNRAHAAALKFVQQHAGHDGSGGAHRVTRGNHPPFTFSLSLGMLRSPKSRRIIGKADWCRPHTGTPCCKPLLELASLCRYLEHMR